MSPPFHTIRNNTLLHSDTSVANNGRQFIQNNKQWYIWGCLKVKYSVLIICPFHTIRYNTVLHSDTCVKLLDTAYIQQCYTWGCVILNILFPLLALTAHTRKCCQSCSLRCKAPANSTTSNTGIQSGTI
jgi:hypothetical protein